MRERKDMGDLPSEVAPPVRNGRRAVVEMRVAVYIEVYESDDYNDMVEQAKDELNRRVVEAKNFYPISARAERITTDAKVDDFRHNTYVDGRGQW
jgi:hypothetical protein